MQRYRAFCTHISFQRPCLVLNRRARISLPRQRGPRCNTTILNRTVLAAVMGSALAFGLACAQEADMRQVPASGPAEFRSREEAPRSERNRRGREKPGSRRVRPSTGEAQRAAAASSATWSSEAAVEARTARGGAAPGGAAPGGAARCAETEPHTSQFGPRRKRSNRRVVRSGRNCRRVGPDRRRTNGLVGPEQAEQQARRGRAGRAAGAPCRAVRATGIEREEAGAGASASTGAR